MMFGHTPLYHHIWNDAFQYSTRSAPRQSSNSAMVPGLFNTAVPARAAANPQNANADSLSHLAEGMSAHAHFG
jgi:hypothetical protein